MNCIYIYIYIYIYISIFIGSKENQSYPEKKFRCVHRQPQAWTGKADGTYSYLSAFKG